MTAIAIREVNDNVVGAVAIYDPNGPMAMIAAAVWLVLAITLWTRYYRTRPAEKYMRPTPLGCSFMFIGFLCRFSRRNGINAWSWLFETLCILLSPCLFLAQNYVLLPRLAEHLGAMDALLLPRRAIVIVYIVGDVITVLAQLAGTALTITFGDLVSIGVKTATAGLWVQAGFFCSFLAIFIVFGTRARLFRFPRSPWSPEALYMASAASCACLLVRSIYRVAEFTAGAGSGLGQSEVAFYLLDFAPNILCAAVFALVWPSHCLSTNVKSSDIELRSEIPTPYWNPAGPK